jgi:hypothetical protein
LGEKTPLGAARSVSGVGLLRLETRSVERLAADGFERFRLTKDALKRGFILNSRALLIHADGAFKSPDATRRASSSYARVATSSGVIPLFIGCAARRCTTSACLPKRVGVLAEQGSGRRSPERVKGRAGMSTIIAAC